jgi:hypothetical protein
MPLTIDLIQVYANCQPAQLRVAVESAALRCAKDVEWRMSAYEGPEIPVSTVEVTLRGPADVRVERPWREESAGVYRLVIACTSPAWQAELEQSVLALIGS